MAQLAAATAQRLSGELYEKRHGAAARRVNIIWQAYDREKRNRRKRLRREARHRRRNKALFPYLRFRRRSKRGERYHGGETASGGENRENSSYR